MEAMVEMKDDDIECLGREKAGDGVFFKSFLSLVGRVEILNGLHVPCG